MSRNPPSRWLNGWLNEDVPRFWFVFRPTGGGAVCPAGVVSTHADFERNNHLPCSSLVALSRAFGFARLLSSLHAGAHSATRARCGYCRRRMGGWQGKKPYLESLLDFARSRLLSYLALRRAGGWRREATGHSTGASTLHASHFTLHTRSRSAQRFAPITARCASSGNSTGANMAAG